jgi:hypothetical protein
MGRSAADMTGPAASATLAAMFDTADERPLSGWLSVGSSFTLGA